MCTVKIFMRNIISKSFLLRSKRNFKWFWSDIFTLIPILDINEDIMSLETVFENYISEHDVSQLFFLSYISNSDFKKICYFCRLSLSILVHFPYASYSNVNENLLITLKLSYQAGKQLGTTYISSQIGRKLRSFKCHYKISSMYLLFKSR